MEACKAATTPMSTNYYLGANEVGPEVNQTMYRVLIGFLLYLIPRIPNIMFVVCLLLDFSLAPRNHISKMQKGS